ncbi:transcriptional regulator [Mesorhizobium loti]|nr:transcriptional regulator [Mesorhizobium loti]
MRNSEIDIDPKRRLAILKALASPVRLAALSYLKDPVANFPAQEDGDLIADGVCADFLRDKLGIAAATTSRHLTLLADCDLLIATRKKGWTFYRRNEQAIARFTTGLANDL